MFTYTRLITNIEQKILENDLLDVKDWIDKAIEGKLNSCKKRAANQYRGILKQEGAATAPLNDDVAIQALFARPDYKNRTQRDQEEEKKLLNRILP